MSTTNQKRTKYELKNAFLYTEFAYLYLLFDEFIRDHNTKQRITYCGAIEMIAGFREYAITELSMNCPTKDFYIEDTEDIMLSVLVNQTSRWIYNAVDIFIDICYETLAPDAQNRVYVRTWLKKLHDEIVKKSAEFISCRDTYRKLLNHHISEEQSIWPEEETSRIETEQLTVTESQQSAVPEGITLKEFLKLIVHNDNYWLNLTFKDKKKTNFECTVKDAISAFEHGDNRGDEILKPSCIKIHEYNYGPSGIYGRIYVNIKL